MNGISHLITAIVDAIAKHYMKKPTGKSIEADLVGNYTLRMQKTYNILGWFCTTLFVIATVGITFDNSTDGPSNAFAYVIPAFGFLILGGGGVLCILYYRNHQVVFDATYIEVTNPLGKVKTSTWDKIIKTKFSHTTGLLTLTDSDGQKLRVNQHLIGLGTFVHLLESKTGLAAGVDVYRK